MKNEMPGTPCPLKEDHFDYERMATIIALSWGGFAIIIGLAVLILTRR
jgi:hypothetical protein